MGIVSKSTLVALVAQTIFLPFVLGSGPFEELLGWGLILGILFAIPSAIVYFPLFTALNSMSLPRWLTIAIGTAVPAAICVAVYASKPRMLTTNNYVLWMAIIGGFAGSYALIRFRASAQ